MKRNINFNEMNLYVRYVQYIEGVENNYYLPWRILYDNFLLFVDRGSMTVLFENKQIVLCENELCIIPPFLKNKLEIQKGQHSWYYGAHFDFFYDDSESFNEDVYIPEKLGYIKEDLTEMPIDEKLAHRNTYYPENIQFPQKIYMHNHVRFRELFGKLLSLFQSESFGHEMLEKSIFYEMFYLIIQKIQDAKLKGSSDGAEIVYRYLQSLTGNYDDQVDMAQIALEYGMPPKKFREVFKKVMRKTPKAYLIERRLQKAKELLETGNYNVSEVAYMLGYEDIFYFSKLFKKKEGISPRKYANQYGKIDVQPKSTK